MEQEQNSQEQDIKIVKPVQNMNLQTNESRKTIEDAPAPGEEVAP